MFSQVLAAYLNPKPVFLQVWVALGAQNLCFRRLWQRFGPTPCVFTDSGRLWGYDDDDDDADADDGDDEQ